MYQIRFPLGSAPDPDPLAGFKAPTSKGREAKNGGRVEEKNEGPTTTKGERRKWIGGREGKRKGFAGPMSNCFPRPCDWRKSDVLWRYLATTKFQPTDARTAFPCFDEPTFKSTFRTTLIHRPSYTALSNMPAEVHDEIILFYRKRLTVTLV